MNIWLYTIQRNEETLLPFWLRHYERFVDKIIFYDHYSTDATTCIAKRHPLVEWRPFDIYKKVDEVVLTEFINNAYKEARGKADWVIWVDGDEFIHHERLWAYLEKQGCNGVQALQPQGYTMVSDHTPTGDGLITDQIRRGVPDDIFSKVAIFDPQIEINYGLGRHYAQPNVAVMRSDIKLLHYRYFGAEWLLKRNEMQWANLSERNKTNGWGCQHAPDAKGYYSPAWFEETLEKAKEVI